MRNHKVTATVCGTLSLAAYLVTNPRATKSLVKIGADVGDPESVTMEDIEGG